MGSKVAEGEAAPLPFPRQTSVCVCGRAVTGVAAAASRQNSGLREGKVHRQLSFYRSRTAASVPRASCGATPIILFSSWRWSGWGWEARVRYKLLAYSELTFLLLPLGHSKLSQLFRS